MPSSRFHERRFFLPPLRTTIRPAVDVAHYLRAVESARDAVRAGDIVKAVIARPITVTSDHPIDVHAVLGRLRASFGSSYRFSVDGFIGASPELLVAVDGDVIRSHPLAGTAPITGDVDNDARLASELIASTKNQVEHRIVIEMVHDTLLPWCSYLDWEPEPSIVKVANVQHLGSSVEGRLSSPAAERARAGARVVADAGRRWPPAFTGARADRRRSRGSNAVRTAGRSAGSTPSATGRGPSRSAVPSCPTIATPPASSPAAAIVADSDPLAELAETQAKFQAMLSAIIRP